MTEIVKNLEVATDNTVGYYDHADFSILNAKINQNFLDSWDDGIGHYNGLKLFKVNLGRNEVFDKYLELKNPAVRQSYNCNCCKSFLRRYGDLVTIDSDTGVTRSILWNDGVIEDTVENSSVFDAAFGELAKLIESAEVTHYFARPHGSWGLGDIEKGGFNHFALDTAATKKIDTATIEVGQRIENFKLIQKNVEKFPIEIVKKLLTYFTFDPVLKNAEQQLRFLQSFYNLCVRYSDIKNTKLKKNILWLVVATGNMGVINIGNGAMGEFLQSVMDGGDIEAAKHAFLKMIDPLNRLRAKAPAKMGTIDAAEKIFEKLGIASALKRRFASLEEIPVKIWTPVVNPTAVVAGGGVFSSLKTLNAAIEKLPQIDGGVMTWSVFERDVLPKAMTLRVKFRSNQRYLFGSVLTAVDPDSKPIFRYDKPEQRNQFSGFYFIDPVNGRALGHPPGIVGVPAHEWITIDSIVGDPDDGFDPVASSGRRLVLSGVKCPALNSLAIFPSDLIPDLYSVRSVIEQFSNTNSVEKSDSALMIAGVSTKGPVDMEFVVTTSEAAITYRVDRGE